MDAHFKAKWVEALRSGRYEQCRDDLTCSGGFCCIGVGYEVFGLSAQDIQDACDDPTDVAARTIGISKQVRDELVAMNDGTSLKRPYTFEEIADYIEANL